MSDAGRTELPEDENRRLAIHDFGGETKRICNNLGYDGIVFMTVLSCSLNGIAERALETGDSVILSHLEGLGLIRDGKTIPAPTTFI